MGLRGAGLRGAVLRGAGLRGAGLRGAGLRGAGLRGDGLRGAGRRGIHSLSHFCTISGSILTAQATLELKGYTVALNRNCKINVQIILD